MPEKINVSKPFSDEVENIVIGILQKTITNAWVEGENYKYNGKDYTFSQDILKINTKNGVRFVFTGQKLGSGSFAHTFFLESFKIENNKLIFSSTPRAVKIDTWRRMKSESKSTFQERVTKEYEFMSTINSNRYLRTKKPIFYEKRGRYYSALVMRILGDFLFSEYLLKNNNWNANFQFLMSIGLLWSAVKLLKEHKIIHRDLKPENIFIELSNPIRFNIFDFGLSRFEHTRDYKTGVGTPLYMAPEAFGVLNGEGSYKSDTFALGCLISFIWNKGEHTRWVNSPQSLEEHKWRLHNLFSYSKDFLNNRTDLDKTTCQGIKDIIQNMRLYEPKQRWDYGKALESFQALYTNLLITVFLKDERHLGAPLYHEIFNFPLEITSKQLNQCLENINNLVKPEEVETCLKELSEEEIKLANLNTRVETSLTIHQGPLEKKHLKRLIHWEKSLNKKTLLPISRRLWSLFFIKRPIPLLQSVRQVFLII